MKITLTTQKVRKTDLAQLEEVSKSYTVEPNQEKEAILREPLLENSLKTEDKAWKRSLPVLQMNNEKAWEPLPNSERKRITLGEQEKTCIGQCCGVEGLTSACCQMDSDAEDLTNLLGPIAPSQKASEEWIKATVKHFQKKGLNFRREDLVIDFEEGRRIGKKFFKDHPSFEDEGNYPMMRFQVFGSRWACKFLNPSSGKCTIPNEQPPMCKSFFCGYMKANFLVKLPGTNSYSKI